MDFQIGKYKDQVLCDIANMSSFHMLLDGPWQCGCRHMHDCVRNVITIVKDGKKHALMPL